MRVHFQMSGGIGFFPGLAAPSTVDVDSLPEGDQQSLREVVDASQFFSLPAHIAAPRGAADYRTYQITIEDGARHHTVSVAEPVTSAPLQQLVQVVRSLAAR
jgi:emfourin